MIPQKIYVAGAYPRRDAIREFVAKIERSGLYVQPRRWFDVEPDGQETPRQSAEADMDAVREADLVVAVMDDPVYAYRGTFTELGAALALNKPVIIIGPASTYAASNVFWHHGHFQHMPDTAAFVHTLMIDAIRG